MEFLYCEEDIELSTEWKKNVYARDLLGSAALVSRA